MQRHVQQALAKLDAEQRDPILLREYEGLSYEEIAAILNIAVGTVKSRIFRGKVELKRLLSPMISTVMAIKNNQAITPLPEISSPSM